MTEAETENGNPALEEAARELQAARHDAQVAYDCIALGDIDRAHTHALTAKVAADAAMTALAAALEPVEAGPAGRRLTLRWTTRSYRLRRGSTPGAGPGSPSGRARWSRTPIHRSRRIVGRFCAQIARRTGLRLAPVHGDTAPAEPSVTIELAAAREPAGLPAPAGLPRSATLPTPASRRAAATRPTNATRWWSRTVGCCCARRNRSASRAA